jgi:hypothetical protein
MSTDHIYYGTEEIQLGVDGHQPVGVLPDDGCCNTDPLCTTDAAAACGFLDLLPSGPMWDVHKQKVREAIVAYRGIPDCNDPCWFECSSMVTYSVYLSQVLQDWVGGALATTVRESNPRTAVTTLDDWLERMNWVDCYRSACTPAHLLQFSPYAYDGECAEQYCAPEFPEEFERALKHGIVQALTRLRRGIIKNLDGINWVIAPLGAELVPEDYPTEVQTYLDHREANPNTYRDSASCSDGSCWCEYATFALRRTSDQLAGAPTEQSFCGTPPAPVAARQTYSCEGHPNVQVYPGLIAAECIVRSLLPRPCPNIVFREGA